MARKKSLELGPRLVQIARGTKTGAIVAAAFGIDIPAPCFARSAVVTSDGYIMAGFTGANGRGHHGAFVGSVAELRQNVQALADYAKLTKEERNAFNFKLKAWLETQYGPVGELVV